MTTTSQGTTLLTSFCVNLHDLIPRCHREKTTRLQCKIQVTLEIRECSGLPLLSPSLPSSSPQKLEDIFYLSGIESVIAVPCMVQTAQPASKCRAHHDRSWWRSLSRFRLIVPFYRVAVRQSDAQKRRSCKHTHTTTH